MRRWDSCANTVLQLFSATGRRGIGQRLESNEPWAVLWFLRTFIDAELQRINFMWFKYTLKLVLPCLQNCVSITIHLFSPLEIGVVRAGLNSWVQVIILPQYPNSWNWRLKPPFPTPNPFLSISISSQKNNSCPFSCLLSPPPPSSIAYLLRVTIYLCFTQSFYRQNDRMCMGSCAWVFWQQMFWGFIYVVPCITAPFLNNMILPCFV